jgi:hypothetical protein
MKYILYGILVYIAYRFIFHFVIPVYKASRHIKKGFREMHERMQEQQGNQQKAYSSTTTSPKTTPARPSANDYIDFEEIK